VTSTPLPPSGNDSEEISVLIRTLRETDQRLDELTAGQIDTVADRDGRSFLLHHAQRELRYTQRRGEERLRRFGKAMDAMVDAIYLVDRSSMRFVHVNDAACGMQNRTREQLLALEPDVVLGISREELERSYDALIAEGGDAKPLELPSRHTDGSCTWIEVRRQAQYSEDGWTIITLVRDVTERKAAENRIAYLNRVHAMLSGIHTLIVREHSRDELLKEACRIAVENGGFRLSTMGVLQRGSENVLPAGSAATDETLLLAAKGTLSDVPTPMTARAIREKRAVISNDLQSDPRVACAKKHTELGVRSLAIFPLLVANEVIGVFSLYANESQFFHEEEVKLLTEITNDLGFAIDHIEKKERLDYLAYYDVLTGLANRTLLLERVAQYLRSAAGNGHKLALSLVDLQRFRNINDSLGRSAGDALLRQVAEWLTSNAGGANLLARVGVDIFAVVLPDVALDRDLARFLEKTMTDFLDHSFVLDGSPFRIAAKVGIAVFPEDGSDADTLFQHAEAALKKAKAGGDRYLFYAQTMTEAVAGKLTLENQLHQALDREEFVLYYQPKVSLVTGLITGVEALIRWNDPQAGLIPPAQFIPILEETGLIHEVGRWALRKAIEDYLRWRASGLAAVRVAVNVSALQLHDRHFVREIEQAIGIDPLAAAGLELEITESLIMEDIKHNIECLRTIRAMGVTVAIDDFGTGFSSLSYLAKLPVHTLKIDRSFVTDMTAGREGLAVVSAIIKLAHSLKLTVVAEGVETAQQSRLLRTMKCDEMQGYLFSVPVSSAILEAGYLERGLLAATPHRFAKSQEGLA
jgi:diguanylate cyclase (GGDEF)-like protein/PAS domain S-box-containing protein